MVDWNSALAYGTAIALPAAMTYLMMPTKQTMVERERLLISTALVGLVTAFVARALPKPTTGTSFVASTTNENVYNDLIRVE